MRRLILFLSRKASQQTYSIREAIFKKRAIPE